MTKARRAIKLRHNKENTKGNEDKLQRIKKLISPTISYDKIKYRNEVYSIGDCVIIKDEIEESFLIGKIVKIIQTNGFKKIPYWPTIQVQWYSILI
jgi:hypothetical protein